MKTIQMGGSAANGRHRHHPRAPDPGDHQIMDGCFLPIGHGGGVHELIKIERTNASFLFAQPCAFDANKGWAKAL
jgi:hypothetical protein